MSHPMPFGASFRALLPFLLPHRHDSPCPSAFFQELPTVSQASVLAVRGIRIDLTDDDPGLFLIRSQYDLPNGEDRSD